MIIKVLFDLWIEEISYKFVPDQFSDMINNQSNSVQRIYPDPASRVQPQQQQQIEPIHQTNYSDYRQTICLDQQRARMK